MDASANKRLRALDRRLKDIFEASYKTAVLNHEKAIAKLAAFDESMRHNAEPERLRTARINYLRQVERTTGIVRSISAEIAYCGQTAARIIGGERLGMFEIGYRHSLNDIDGKLGCNMRWDLYDRNQLKAILDGEILPFERVGARLVYDRRQRQYIRERAFGRLGDDKVIVCRLQNELAQAVVLGESISKIAARIKRVTEMSRRQAVTVARTETLRAANQGRMLGFYQARDDYGIEMLKKWISTRDSKTRDSHRNIDGETAELDEPFSNGLMHPLDPNGAAEEVIHCRCTVVSELKGFDFK